MRWRHPTRGLISPGVFIPIAEKQASSFPLGDCVLREACADAKSWPRIGARGGELVAAAVRARGVADLVRRALRDTKFPPNRLEAEITEIGGHERPRKPRQIS